METVTISSQYRIVISKQVREQLGLKAGQKLRVICYQNQLILVPVKPVHEMRGFVRKIDPNVKRETDRI